MNKNNIILTATSLALAIGVLSADAKSFKRGVSENAFNLKEEIDVIKTGTSWFYTWGNVPNNNIKDLPDADFEFVPMCWNANYNADNIRSYCKSHPETKYLLGFNEPNFKNQANMTPEAAAAAWPAVQALAKELAPSNIQVNAISCGVIDTAMNHCFSPEEMNALREEIPADRLGQPEEVAKLVLQLIQAPTYLTGQILTLDGGWQ